jgi:holin-like protein
MKPVVTAAIQIAALAAVNQLGYLSTDFLQLPVPGNLIAMLMLLALLSTGIVRLSWIEAGAQVLLTHLAFFFVPIAVGLMAFTDLLQRDGVAWLFALLVAAAAGIVSAGIVTQTLTSRIGQDQHASRI